MGLKQRNDRGRRSKISVESIPRRVAAASSAAPSRAMLLAGASLAALVAVGGPGAAWAACTPSPQTISTPITGPVFANGGSISILSSGSIGGARVGVFAQHCSIDTLTNNGSIGAAHGAPEGAGGIGVRANAGETINLLDNTTGATISGGRGGFGLTTFAVGAGGAGVSSAGAIAALTNSGGINGGNGGRGFFGGTGGAGIANSGALTTLTNMAAIRGGAGGSGSSGGGAGGAGLTNSGTLRTLSNSGAILGGDGGSGLFSADRVAQAFRIPARSGH